jgi:hypothetical protein
LLDKTATIQRLAQEADAQGVVKKKPTATVIGSFPCSAAQSSTSLTQGEPQAKQTKVYSLCFMADADIKVGDLAVIPGIGKLRLDPPGNVRGHHLEVSGAWEGDV